MSIPHENTPAPAVEKAGEQVTGGNGESQENSTENTTPENQSNEYTPDTETSKEEMTGYNELPDQEKVGGA